MSEYCATPLTPRQRGRLRRQVATDRDLSPAARQVMALLDDHYNHKTGYTFPNQPTMAKALGCRRETINRAVAQLERRGYLRLWWAEEVPEAARGKKERGRFYELLSPADEQAASKDGSRGERRHHDTRTAAHSATSDHHESLFVGDGMGDQNVTDSASQHGHLNGAMGDQSITPMGDQIVASMGDQSVTKNLLREPGEGNHAPSSTVAPQPNVAARHTAATQPSRTTATTTPSAAARPPALCFNNTATWDDQTTTEEVNGGTGRVFSIEQLEASPTIAGEPFTGPRGGDLISAWQPAFGGLPAGGSRAAQLPLRAADPEPTTPKDRVALFLEELERLGEEQPPLTDWDRQILNECDRADVAAVAWSTVEQWANDRLRTNLSVGAAVFQVPAYELWEMRGRPTIRRVHNLDDVGLSRARPHNEQNSQQRAEPEEGR